MDSSSHTAKAFQLLDKKELGADTFYDEGKWVDLARIQAYLGDEVTAYEYASRGVEIHGSARPLLRTAKILQSKGFKIDKYIEESIQILNRDLNGKHDISLETSIQISEFIQSARLLYELGYASDEFLVRAEEKIKTDTKNFGDHYDELSRAYSEIGDFDNALRCVDSYTTSHKHAVPYGKDETRNSYSR